MFSRLFVRSVLWGRKQIFCIKNVKTSLCSRTEGTRCRYCQGKGWHPTVEKDLNNSQRDLLSGPFQLLSD